jgi:hypothetical protein
MTVVQGKSIFWKKRYCQAISYYAEYYFFQDIEWLELSCKGQLIYRISNSSEQRAYPEYFRKDEAVAIFDLTHIVFDQWGQDMQILVTNIRLFYSIFFLDARYFQVYISKHTISYC